MLLGFIPNILRSFKYNCRQNINLKIPSISPQSHCRDTSSKTCSLFSIRLNQRDVASLAVSAVVTGIVLATRFVNGLDFRIR
jgi:hypothetical protein